MNCGEFRETYRADMAIFETNFARGLLALFLVALCFAPAVLPFFWMDVLNRILIAVIAATGLNILTGFTGQISLGNAAFLAVGAYSTAFFAGRLGLPFPIVIPLAGGYLDPIFGGGVKEVAPFIALVAILSLKPYGLFGKVKIERV